MGWGYMGRGMEKDWEVADFKLFYVHVWKCHSGSHRIQLTCIYLNGDSETIQVVELETLETWNYLKTTDYFVHLKWSNFSTCWECGAEGNVREH